MPGKRILVVDDDAGVRTSVELLLKRLGHSVETAADGTAALAKMSTAAFDLVVTDLEMPGIKGDQLAREVKKRQPALPVVMLTGTIEVSRVPGVDLIVFKPFSLDDLRSALQVVPEPA